MTRKFLKYLLLFFFPVILGYVIIEILTLNLPLGYKYTSEYLQQNKSGIQVLILGSSQLANAINPDFLSTPTLNMASGNQHHDTDLKILKQLQPQLPNLKTVVLEVSYSHFELPHNGRDFWKNNVYLKYYNINAFERPAYFKDKLVYLSNPPFFSVKLYNHFILNEGFEEYNNFGFDTNNYFGRFKILAYNESEILKTKFKINSIPDLKLFKNNTTLFYEILDYLKENELNIIICKAPMYKSYLPKRNSEILKRRDSILNIIHLNYPNIIFLDKEEDTLNYNVFDYKNQSHLNPDGAEKFTGSLSKLLDL